MDDDCTPMDNAEAVRFWLWVFASPAFAPGVGLAAALWPA